MKKNRLIKPLEVYITCDREILEELLREIIRGEFEKARAGNFRNRIVKKGGKKNV